MITGDASTSPRAMPSFITTITDSVGEWSVSLPPGM